ncbi:substrate-binding domain-containing protein [Amycolatopsis endophytica]|uniref:Phosphate transport system substrate-binding protein n=1 Tax=Amycolatopsis endophytica TaxID=860233 RepID=A0A853B5R9_9PSEU|nr:substrate-binding domain-containing protein [Amycolatopsis endophytica]NYI90114.1 phosphate transport system substrate-binding protein [Amycolatopsis endophytica]
MHRRTWLALAGASVVLATQVLFAPSAAAFVQANGSGSTYVGLAMSDWQNGANSRGIPVNYSALGSPAGVNQYGDRTVDFAGTEAEVSSLQAAGGGGVSATSRGFQYVPDVAGAVAVMYNVTDAAGRRVDSLHLTRQTVARIFARDITRWSDPEITRTNGGFPLPDQPITLIGRSGQSGTTALFYDFVAHMAPGPYNAFVSRNANSGVGHLPAGVRPIQLPTVGADADNYRLFADSDQIAQTIATGSVPFSIGYDEFGYAKKYNAPTAWVDNQAGEYTLPYAQNIAAALTKANLRPDLSQELSGVYTNPDPATYPISAYSYLMTPCSGGRETCRGGYPDGAKTETMAAFIEHIACDGQINMARIGYSPLPPNLSQEMMNANARLTGQAPKQLSAGNCSNPTFHGSLGAGATAPEDPFVALGGVDALTNGGTGNGTAGPGTNGPEGAGTGGPSDANATPGTEIAAEESLANGGSTDWRNAEPAAYENGGFGGFGAWAALVLLVAIAAPLLLRGALRGFRRQR